MKEEIWMPIKGYEGLYEISSYGRIKSLPRTVVCKNGMYKPIRGRIMSLPKCSSQYRFVALSKGGKVKQYLLHRLVALHFIGEKTLEINHIDGNKDNNCVENLEYVTHSENQLHAFRVLNRKPVKSWLNKRGFEHNKSIHIKLIDTQSGETKEFGSLRLAEEQGYDRTILSKALKMNSLYHKRYKIEKI